MQELVELADFFMDSSETNPASRTVKGGNIYFRERDNAIIMDYHQ